MNAFLYLVLTSGRNRLRGIVRRVRSPRYAIALLAGAAYIWAFLVRPFNAPIATPILLGKPTEMLATVLVVLTLMGSWIFGSDVIALAFTQAELSFLFPAPLSRRALIGYKLFRAQIAVTINALIWVFVLRRGGTALPSPLRAIGLWALFSTLNLHRLGAALVRSSWREHGAAGVRRHRWAILAFGIVGTAIAVSLARHGRELLGADGVGHFFGALGRALASPPASWGLLPFHLVVAPTFARTPAAWGRAILPAVAVMLVHLWWVLRSDAAFEDAAIQASSERLRRLDAIRARRGVGAGSMGTPRAATSTIALAARGHPAVAILWKNLLCLRRTAQLRVFIGPVAMAAALGFAIADDADAAGRAGAILVLLAGLLVIFGGRMIRNDLRQDMQHLPLLKSLPVSPAQLLVAEVASAALPMAALQLTLVVLAATCIGLSSWQPLSGSVRLGLLLGAPFGVLALNAALLTIQNGIAVLFPGWIRLGPSVSTGVEMLGQNVLATAANLVSLGAALILPVIAAYPVVRAARVVGPLSLALAIAWASVLLGVEVYFALRLLGRAFAKAEPGATGDTLAA